MEKTSFSGNSTRVSVHLLTESELWYGCTALGKFGSRARAHHLRAGPSRTLPGNEQTALSLGMPGKETKSPRILTSLTSGGQIDRRQKTHAAKRHLLGANLLSNIRSPQTTRCDGFERYESEPECYSSCYLVVEIRNCSPDNRSFAILGEGFSSC